MSNTFHIFANAALGKGLSGGDRIFIEFAKRLSKKYPVTIQVWREGYLMCQRQGLKRNKNLKFALLKVDNLCKLGFLICYLARIVASLVTAFRINVINEKSTVIYSASEFWMDSLPALILKLRFPKITWAAGWFQTAPNPLIGFTQGHRKDAYRLSAFYHWFMQLPIKPLIEAFADFVLVNNDEEKKQFPSLNKQDKAIVILGAVNTDEIEYWKSKHSREDLPKIYQAVFQGRFHPQKGVVELISIWKIVTNKLPDAELAMIGDGPLMDEVKNKIKELGLQKNVYLFGYVFDGDEKYRIFSQSQIVVHPSFYDSGGMASAEAMAFGLPCIGFNLESYKSYYPKGMVKVAVGDLQGFANMIIELLENKNKRDRIGRKAQKIINENWSWDKRVNQLMTTLKAAGYFEDK